MKWIRIEDDKPPLKLWVLAIAENDPDGIIRFARALAFDVAFEGTDAEWHTVSWQLEPDCNHYYSPTHWMPRPEPPNCTKEKAQP